MTDAKTILNEIKQANSILLHCHPSPDPDSVGSTLAMKFALEQLGKKATIISGDSEIPNAFMHFPGAGEIEKKSFAETDLARFDLFIILDSSSPEMISKKNIPTFPLAVRSIVIDHHATNKGYADVNLVDSSYPATCLILHDLFKEWGIKLDGNIAPNLFMGSYTDTGGFKYAGVTAKTFRAVSEIVEHVEDMPSLVARMENSNTPGLLAFEAVCLDNITVYFDLFAVSTASNSALVEKGVRTIEMKPGLISSIMRSVPQWKITASGAEVEPGIVKWSFRSSNAELYDVARLAAELGGGGHKAAAGAVLSMSIEEAEKKVVETAKLLYNL